MKPAGLSPWLRAGWAAALFAASGVRIWNALVGTVLRGYDALGHVSYVLFLDLYRAVPYADQGWSYFHPPLHYMLGWLLAQLGDGTVLVRGLALLGGAASLGIALLGASLVRMAMPDRPGLPLLAFVAIAFLPVHLYGSPMPGNEFTAAFLGACAVVAFVRNEAREYPRRGGAILVGVLGGLALLTKFNAVIPLAALAAVLGLRALRRREPLFEPVLRGILVVTAVGALAGPYYARNVVEFGNPFQLSRVFGLVQSVEGKQPPGQRSLRDFVSISPRLFANPTPTAPHMVRSVWGTLYASVWSDASRSSTIGAPAGDLREQRLQEESLRTQHALLLLAGLLPTALAGIGALLSGVVAWRRRDDLVDTTCLLLAAASLGAFATVAWTVPIWSALKATYLLHFSMPYGLFVTRAASRSGALRRSAPFFVVVAAMIATFAFTAESRARGESENLRMALIHAHFGDFDGVRRIFDFRTKGSRDRVRALDLSLGGMELAAGAPESALAVYRRYPPGQRAEPHASRRAVAEALVGDSLTARRLFDALIARRPSPDVLANRGALRAREGDLAGAEADLRAALEGEPAFSPAWTSLAFVLRATNRSSDADAALERGTQFRSAPPRGLPYEIGNGFEVNGRRFLLVWEGESLRLWTSPRLSARHS